MKYRNTNSKKPFLKFPLKISTSFLIATVITLVVAGVTIACINFIFKDNKKNEVLPENASVLNYDVSKTDRDNFDNFVHNEIIPKLNNLCVTIKFDSRNLDIKGNNINLHVNADNIFDILNKSDSKSVENIPSDKLIFDKKALENIITNFSNTSQIFPSDYSYKINKNKLTVTAGRNGKKINVDKTMEKVIEAFSQIRDSEIEAVFDETEPKNREIDFAKIKKAVDCEPQDAGYKTKNGVPSIERERVGVLLPSSEIKKITDSSNGSYVLDLIITQPKVTTVTLRSQALRDERFQTPLSHFSTSLNNKTANGIFNIKKAAKAINNVVLLPGDVFSFDAAVEAEKRAHPNEPYREAITYNVNSPTGEEMGIGGGMCQVCSTIFNAALRANLPIVERQPHSFRVYYVPVGQDAGYSHGSKDLKFKNNQPYPVIVKANVSGSSLNCQITGMRTKDNTFDVTVIPKQLSDDGHYVRAQATQIVKQNGAEISRRTFNSCYKVKPKERNRRVPTTPPAPPAQPPASAQPATPNAPAQPTATNNPTQPATPNNAAQPTVSNVPNTSSNTQPPAPAPNTATSTATHQPTSEVDSSKQPQTHTSQQPATTASLPLTSQPKAATQPTQSNQTTQTTKPSQTSITSSNSNVTSATTKPSTVTNGSAASTAASTSNIHSSSSSNTSTANSNSASTTSKPTSPHINQPAPQPIVVNV